MRKDRLLAFSDGMFAIIITIMVLDLKVPHGADLAALAPIAPTLLSYVLSFLYVAIYWNNHHHMLELAHKINGACLWANMALLFFLSLVPFSTAWMGETHFAEVPVALYGVTLLMPALAYTVLQRTLVRAHPDNAELAAVVGRDFKGKVSLVLYVAGILAAILVPTIYAPWLALCCFVTVALIWLVPDRRIERRLME